MWRACWLVVFGLFLLNVLVFVEVFELVDEKTKLVGSQSALYALKVASVTSSSSLQSQYQMLSISYLFQSKNFSLICAASPLEKADVYLYGSRGHLLHASYPKILPRALTVIRIHHSGSIIADQRLRVVGRGPGTCQHGMSIALEAEFSGRHSFIFWN